MVFRDEYDISSITVIKLSNTFVCKLEFKFNILAPTLPRSRPLKMVNILCMQRIENFEISGL
jgi:hypothetical protein